MELKLNSGDTITIPDGCRAVIKDKIIAIEKEVQEFKDGDFVVSNNLWAKILIIYKSKKEGSNANCHAIVCIDRCENYVSYNDWSVCYDARIATEEEKQFLLDALHADGKDWDAVNKKIIEYRWKPEMEEDYYVISAVLNVIRLTWNDTSFELDLLQKGNCFKTEEEAQAKADQIIKILNK